MYLNLDKISSFDVDKFQKNTPFPWQNIEGLLNYDSYITLSNDMPSIDLFEKHENLDRNFGQKPHDRFELVYTKKVKNLPDCWLNFIDELKGKHYFNFISKVLGINDYKLKFQWQYSSKTNDLSPHTDSPNKVATHIFYMNNKNNWKEDWGGHTIILDDNEKLDHKSSPTLDQFSKKYKSKSLENRSLLFKRTDHSWHSLDPLNCPTDKIRKVFSVIIYPTDYKTENLKQKLYFLLNRNNELFNTSFSKK